MPTEERIAKVKKVLAGRYADLRVVMEDVKNTHNASAVVRTCDAAGILFLDVISFENEPFPINEAISTRAEKWLQIGHYTETRKCLNDLKNEGFSIAATYLGEGTTPYTDVDFTKPTAIIFGNEAEGISPKARELADCTIHVPMVGMVRSLNLSVTVGIILYEAIRQRLVSPAYAHKSLQPEELESLALRWLGMD